MWHRSAASGRNAASGGMWRHRLPECGIRMRLQLEKYWPFCGRPASNTSFDSSSQPGSRIWLLSLQMFMHPEHGWPEGPCSEPRPALASRLVKGAGGFGRHCGSQRSLASPSSQANPVAVACGCTAYLCAGEGPQAWTREMRHT